MKQQNQGHFCRNVILTPVHVDTCVWVAVKGQLAHNPWCTRGAWPSSFMHVVVDGKFESSTSISNIEE